MDERVMQLRIGLMVLATLVIVSILLTLFGGQRSLFERFQHKDLYYVQFPEAPEVTPDTPVQKNGVRIGRVAKVRLADEVTDPELDDDAGVLVTIEVDKDRRIFSDEVCRIKRNLLGDALLEFVRTGAAAGAKGQGGATVQEAGFPRDVPNGGGDAPKSTSKQEIESGALLRGEVQSDPLQVVANLEENLFKALTSVDETSDEIRAFVAKINNFMGTEEELGPRKKRLDDILDASLETMQTMGVLANNINDVVGDEGVQQKLKDTVAEFPLVMQDARTTLGKMSDTFDGMQLTMEKVDNNLEAIDDFSIRLGEEGPEMISKLNGAAGNLDLLLGDMRGFTQNLQAGDGTVGRLIRDPELYDNLNQAVLNVEDLTQRLQPAVENFRVFSDKIARHPELLGVRGALEKSSGTKGVPQMSQLLGTSEPSRAPTYPRFFQPQ